MKRRKHPHLWTDELHIYMIPRRDRMSMGLQVVQNRLPALADALETDLLHMIHDDGLPSLDCGCPMALGTIYDSQANENFPLNSRASSFFEELKVRGDAFLIGHGIVKDAVGNSDVDFVSLTPEFHDWAGPGHPIPQAVMPWEA